MHEQITWKHPFYVPAQEPHRIQCIAALQSYLRLESNQSGFTFTFEDDPQNRSLLWISMGDFGYQVPAEILTALVTKVETNIRSILANQIVPPPEPKSVYDWLRENPYK